MGFNLKKTSQIPTEPIAPDLQKGLGDVIKSLKEPDKLTTEDVYKSVDDTEQKEEKTNLLKQQENLVIWESLQKLLESPEYQELSTAVNAPPEIREIAQQFSSGNIEALKTQMDRFGIVPSSVQMENATPGNITPQDLRNLLNRALYISKLPNPQQAVPVRASTFNLSKQSQVQTETIQEVEISNQSRTEFVNRYLPLLIQYSGQKDAGDLASERALEEIRQLVSPILENDANDALRNVQMSEDLRDAQEKLELIFDKFIPQTEKVASQKMPNNNAFNLSLHVLKNNEQMVKTADKHFGTSYILYGPTEKRICPKLSGKGISNVVSEDICRSHCLDGIVIDDNKTICGEALWRANVMDKFHREYVDKEGNITGGYIEKRFIVEHNVPEENRMRLKPGELRKPRPASMGNLEARMQDMRSKKERNYRPTTDETKPFDWAKDVDQNNVVVSQKERERREKDSGHEVIEHKKSAFNLKTYKTAQGAPATLPVADGRPIEPQEPVGNVNPDSNLQPTNAYLTWKIRDVLNAVNSPVVQTELKQYNPETLLQSVFHTLSQDAQNELSSNLEEPIIANNKFNLKKASSLMDGYELGKRLLDPDQTKNVVKHDIPAALRNQKRRLKDKTKGVKNKLNVHIQDKNQQPTHIAESFQTENYQMSNEQNSKSDVIEVQSSPQLYDLLFNDDADPQVMTFLQDELKKLNTQGLGEINIQSADDSTIVFSVSDNEPNAQLYGELERIVHTIKQKYMSSVEDSKKKR